MSENEPSSKKVKHSSQCAVYDFTFFGPKDGELQSPEEFIKLIQPLFKKWIFQLEACPTTERKHYQGRGSLIKKKRKPELDSLLNNTDLRGMDTRESSNNSLILEVFYTLKYDTCIAGPWRDDEWHQPQYIPRQFRGLEDRLYPWQQQVIASKDVFNDRVVNLIYDKGGCQGKSTIARLAQLHHNALRLPPVGDHKQLLEAACDILMAKQNRSPGLAFVDLPRSLTMDPKKFGPFMIAIEEIKAGVVCDMRNHFKEWWFDSPQVWVFCNHLPHLDHMSQDRWKFWVIDGFKNLMPKSKDEMIQMIQSPEI